MLTGKEDLLQALIDAYIMEKGTREFYAQAAQKALDPEARKTFNELSAWENRHMEFIQFLYQAITDDRDIKGFEDFSNKSHAPAAEGSRPLKDLEAKMEKFDFLDDTGAITMALEIEGKAYNLYHRLSKIAPDTNAKVVFKDMMEQEIKHIDHLKSMMLKLSETS
ncbi:MAG: ferritin family protein [Nitrospirae bacterium]|nr:ferritin family protein [Nitrospirota bacterium]